MLDGPETDLRFNTMRRSSTPYESSYATEVISFQDRMGGTRQYFCKFGRTHGAHNAGGSVRSLQGTQHTVHGIRRGVAHEALVYREILARAPARSPRFVGSALLEDSGVQILVIEYLREALEVAKSTDPLALNRAARWIGSFHGWSKDVVRAGAASFLIDYDAGFLNAWVDRAAQFTDHAVHPWFSSVCGAARCEMIRPLSISPSVVLHGEYYSENVLESNDEIVPVDWESAALGAGELDLAALTFGWPEPQAVEACNAYACARWNDGVPDEFHERLMAARFFVLFRWLGDRIEWTRAPVSRAHYTKLQQLAQTIGVL
jgi:aminoglycoside phosphotransferase (APT) family kinase protein